MSAPVNKMCGRSLTGDRLGREPYPYGGRVRPWTDEIHAAADTFARAGQLVASSEKVGIGFPIKKMRR